MQPLPSNEILNEMVEDYCQYFIGEPQDAVYYHEMIAKPGKRYGWMWEEFISYVYETLEEDLISKTQ